MASLDEKLRLLLGYPHPPSESPSPSEAVTTPIVGWRYWMVREDGVLVSSYNAHVWDGPTTKADTIPARENSNGIYAVATKEQVPMATDGSVWGEVELSGVVVIGERGYRGEIATVRSIHMQRRQIEVPIDGIVPPQTYGEWPSASLVGALEQRYAVEVTVEVVDVVAQAYRQHIQQLQQFYGSGIVGQALGYAPVSSAMTAIYPGQIVRLRA